MTKVAAGGVEWLEFAQVSSIPAALRVLRAQGLWTVGLDAGGVETIFTLPVARDRLALVVGAEGRGLSPLTRHELEVVAAVPMASTVSSLNASVAVGIALAVLAERRSAS